jgi:hypothetical protein
MLEKLKPLTPNITRKAAMEFFFYFILRSRDREELYRLDPTV